MIDFWFWYSNITFFVAVSFQIAKYCFNVLKWNMNIPLYSIYIFITLNCKCTCFKESESSEKVFFKFLSKNSNWTIDEKRSSTKSTVTAIVSLERKSPIVYYRVDLFSVSNDRSQLCLLEISDQRDDWSSKLFEVNGTQ